MDYMIEVTKGNNKEQALKGLERCLIYQSKLRKLEYSRQSSNEKKNDLQKLWEKESNLERRIFQKFEEWEKRHPLLGIFICTVLMGILISLLAGIILEAIYA